jgi:hypothetical protein
MGVNVKIRTLTFKAIKNLGNYETKALEVTVELAPKDDVNEVLQDLEEFVLIKIGKKSGKVVTSHTCVQEVKLKHFDL